MHQETLIHLYEDPPHEDSVSWGKKTTGSRPRGDRRGRVLKILEVAICVVVSSTC